MVLARKRSRAYEVMELCVVCRLSIWSPAQTPHSKQRPFYWVTPKFIRLIDTIVLKSCDKSENLVISFLIYVIDSWFQIFVHGRINYCRIRINLYDIHSQEINRTASSYHTSSKISLLSFVTI